VRRSDLVWDRQLELPSFFLFSCRLCIIFTSATEFSEYFLGRVYIRYSFYLNDLFITLFLKVLFLLLPRIFVEDFKQRGFLRYVNGKLSAIRTRVRHFYYFIYSSRTKCYKVKMVHVFIIGDKSNLSLAIQNSNGYNTNALARDDVMDHAAASDVHRVVTSSLHRDRQRPISEYGDVPGDVSTHILAQPSFLSYFCSP